MSNSQGNIAQNLVEPALKKYLSIDETIKYVSNSYSYLFDLDSLIDLCKEDKLTPVFLFLGYATDETDRGYSKVKGYFTADDMFFNVVDPRQGYPADCDAIFQPPHIEILYHYQPYELIRCDNACIEKFDHVFLFKSLPFDDTNQFTIIEFEDLRFDFTQINKIFNVASTADEQPLEKMAEMQATIDQQAARIAELEALLEQSQKVKGNETATDDIKASTYQLICAMKDLLLDADITQSLFVYKDNPNAKQRPTQDMLSKYIDEMNIKGLGARNINGIFATANKFKR